MFRSEDIDVNKIIEQNHRFSKTSLLIIMEYRVCLLADRFSVYFNFQVCTTNRKAINERKRSLCTVSLRRQLHDFTQIYYAHTSKIESKIRAASDFGSVPRFPGYFHQSMMVLPSAVIYVNIYLWI